MASNKTIQQQTQRQLPQQYLISSMLEATDDELLRMIHDEEEKNITLEVVDNDGMSDGSQDQDVPQDEASHEDVAAESADVRESEPVVPLFEYDDDSPSDRIGTRYSDDDDDSFVPGSNTSAEVSFRDDLKRQVEELDLTPEQRYLAFYIIDSLDDSGYLTIGLKEMAAELELSDNHFITIDDLEEVLVEVIQQELDPPGIGARDLRECMLLQLLDRKATPATRIAYLIVDKAFEDLAQKRYDKLQDRLGIGHQTLVDALRVIRTLQPKPGGNSVASGASSYRPAKAEDNHIQVRPAFIVTHPEDDDNDNSLLVTINDGRMPEVRVSAEQESLLQTMTEPKAVKFLKDNIASAQSFISALHQRRVTMMHVMQSIVNMQRQYFLTGEVEQLRPMQMTDVSEVCGCDVSTVSRVVSSKYVQTDFGIIPLRNLFRNGAKLVSAENSTEGGEPDSAVSSAAIDAAIRELIDGEDKHRPMTDEVLAMQLAERGFKMARRTVMKYRERLGYPVGRLRKEL